MTAAAVAQKRLPTGDSFESKQEAKYWEFVRKFFTTLTLIHKLLTRVRQGVWHMYTIGNHCKNLIKILLKYIGKAMQLLNHPVVQYEKFMTHRIISIFEKSQRTNND